MLMGRVLVQGITTMPHGRRNNHQIASIKYSDDDSLERLATGEVTQVAV